MLKWNDNDPLAKKNTSKSGSLKWNSNDPLAKAQTKKPPMDFSNNIYQRKGVSKSLIPAAPSPWKRLPAAGGIGLLKGNMDLADKINTLNYLPQAPLSTGQAETLQKKGFLRDITSAENIAKKPAGTYSKQADTLPYDDTTLEGLKEKAGLQGTLAEDIMYGIGKETPAIVASYGTVGAATKIPTIGKALTGAGKWTETGRRGVAAGALYTPIAEEKPEVKYYLENMALFGLGDVAFMGAAHGIGQGIKTLKGVKSGSLPMRGSTSFDAFHEPVLPTRVEPNPDYAPWVRKDLIGKFNQQRAEELPKILTREQDPWAGMREPVTAPLPYAEAMAKQAERIKGNRLSETPFTDVLEQLQPKVSEQTTAPMESRKALVDYIHDHFNGEISKNEIRRMSYDEMADMAQNIAKERQGDLWGTMKTEGDKLGIDVDKRYRLETDPEYRAEWERLRKAAGLEEEPINFLIDAEIAARQRITDRNKAYKPGNMNFSARNPLDDIRDLAIIGASKILRGVSNPKQWAEELVAEFGEIIRKRLPEIWEQSKAILANEEGFLRIGKSRDQGDYGQYGDVRFKRGDAENGSIVSGEWDKINPTANNNRLGEKMRLNQRVKGDKLLDAEDLAAEIKDNGGTVDENGYVTLYHRTSKQNADAIISSGKMKAKEDGVFFSTKADGQNTGYGDTLIEFKVPVERLELDDVFGNEAHLRIPLKNRDQTANVGDYIVNRSGENTGPGEKKIRTNNQGAPENGGLFNGDAKFKKSPAPPEIQAQLDEATKEFGWEKKWAPDAMKSERFQAANDLCKTLTGRDIITYTSNEGEQGFAMGRQAFINARSKQPTLYVTAHEITHTMETSHPEYYVKLKDIVVEHVSDDASIIKHYVKKFGYDRTEVPDELTADILAECMMQKTFWERVRDKSPELLKPILDTIDRILNIAKKQTTVPGKYQMMQHMKDVEVMRDRLAVVYQDYLKATKEEQAFVKQFGGKWQEPAAKAKAEAKPEADATNPDIRYKLDPENRADQYRNMVLAAARQGGEFAQGFKDAMLKQFPHLADEPQVDNILRFVYDRARELRRGQTSFAGDGQSVNINRSELGLTPETGQNMKDWNHITSKTSREWPGIKQGTKNVANATYRETVDDLYRLYQTDPKAYQLALNSRESGGTAKQILVDGLYDPKGNKIGDSLAGITKQIPKGAEQDFSNYLIYRHAPSWLEQGRQVFPENEGITADISRQRAAAYEQAHPEFKQTADNLIQWQRDFGKAWLVDTGIIKPETWNVLQQMYPDYVPFQRGLKDIEKGGLGAKRGFANQSSPIKKAEGSQRQIVDPIESIIENVDKYVKIARRNEVMQTLYRDIQKSPEDFADWIEILPEKGETFESAYAKDGLDGLMNWLEEPFEAIKDRKSMRYDKPNVVRAQVNGETVHVKVHDAPLLDALTALSPQEVNKAIEIVRQGTRTMKLLTTGANVFFASRNIVRDLPTSYLFSDTLTKVPGADLAQWAWGIVDSSLRIMTNGKYDPGKYFQTYKALGGGTHSSALAADRNLLAESKAKVMPGYLGLDHPLKSTGRALKGAGRGIEKFTNAVETVPRLPEYIRTAKKGGNTYEARQAGLHAAQDITVNFSRHGGKAEQTADAFIPYFNASVQGIDKFFRAHGKNPGRIAARGITALTIPTIYLWAINHDNPNYQKLSQRIKDNFFCIPRDDGTFLRLPKPREIGVVYSTLPERILDKCADDKPEAFKGIGEAIFDNFAPPIRSIGAPVSDVRANKNWYGAPIVPGYMEDLSPELQYDEKTSAPAIWAGGKLDISPKMLDYIFKSYTGFIGDIGIPATSEGQGQSKLQRAGEVLKKTYIADPVYSNDTVSNFYDEKDKLDTARKDANYLGQIPPDDEKSSIYNKIAGDIGGLNKQSREINKNPLIPFEQKKVQTRQLKEQINSLAQQGLDGTFKIPEEWKNKPEWIIRLYAKGETNLPQKYIKRSYQHNAFGLYEYGLKNGMVDKQGNPNAQLNSVLSDAWGAQNATQAKSASYQFLKHAAETDNQEQAIRWAQIAKQSGLKYSDVKSRIRQAARPSTPGAKTPTLEQVLAGGTRMDSKVAQRILWAFQQ